MPDLLIAILAVVFVLGVAINIHEFGHFIVAKLLGMRVEAYSFFGLGPRVWGFKRGHTDYRISAIPLGAYVKLYGDEATTSLEGGQSQGEQVPESELYELRPRWQKFLVMLGGPFMNIVLALAIPFVGALLYGIPALPDPLVARTIPNGAAERAGVKVGDRIVAFDGEENPTWRRIENNAALSPEKALPITVERNGERIALQITPVKKDMDGQPMGDLEMRPDSGVETVVMEKIVPDRPAAAAGFQPGDRVISFNGQNVKNRDALMASIAAAKDAPFTLKVDRFGEKKDIQVQAQPDDKGVPKIGVELNGISEQKREPAGLAESASHALNVNWEILRLTGRAFSQVSSGERAAGETFSGPVGIVQIIVKVVREQGVAGLFGILALISLNLGVFNLLPIPMLDGGQIMVLGIEKFLSFFGKTLSLAIKEKIQLAGLAMILLLMVFVMYNDISKLFR
jgi:regulator of sigma E protease